MERYKTYRKHGHSRTISAMHAIPFIVPVIIGLLIGWFVL